MPASFDHRRREKSLFHQNALSRTRQNAAGNSLLVCASAEPLATGAAAGGGREDQRGGSGGHHPAQEVPSAAGEPLQTGKDHGQQISDWRVLTTLETCPPSLRRVRL